MIGQDYDRIDRKWVLLPSLAKCRAESVDMVDKSRRPTVGERHREKVDSTLNPIAPISDHSASYPGFQSQMVAARSFPDIASLIRATGPRTTPPP
jgi:hypothetical protein